MKRSLICVFVVILLLALPCIVAESSFRGDDTKNASAKDTAAVVYDTVAQETEADDAVVSEIPAAAESGDPIETQLVVAYSDDSLAQDDHFVSSTGDFYLLTYETATEAAAAKAQFAADEKAENVDNPIVMTVMETDDSSLEPLEDTVDYLITGADVGTSLTTEVTYLSYGPVAMDVDTFEADLLTKYNSVENMPEIVVGIVDTGIDSDHPFLSDRILDYSYTCVADTVDAEDDNGHGTHVAGIVVDATLGNVKLNAYKIADSEGDGTDYSVACGINQAVADGVDVINVSMGGNGPSAVLDKAVANATAAGVLVCVAAGNGNLDADNCVPASCNGAFTVSAVDSSLVKASFSNYGDCVDIAAPGVSIKSSCLAGTYVFKSGTSMATPFVAAAAALLLSYEPTDSVSDLKHLLSSYTVDAGTAGWDPYYGYGVLNLSYIESGDCIFSFDANGGSEVDDVLMVPAGDACPALPTTTLKGNDFLGWYDTAGDRISAGDTIDDIGRVELTAEWGSSTYLVTLDANGGSCTSTSVTVTYGETYGTLPMPTWVGHTFAGWYTSSEEKILSSSTVSLTSDITLTARWVDIYYKINVSGGENGSISPSTCSVIYGSAKAFTITPDCGFLIESVTVDGVNVGADSSYTFSDITSNHTISATFIWDKPFTDVISCAWYYDSVQKATTMGLFTGTSATLFSPDVVMTRAMFVSVLYRYDGSPTVSGTTAFTDVSQSYYYDAVLWASQNGIVNGTSATTFSPDAAVSRQQMVVFLSRYCGSYKGYDVSASADLSGYSDMNRISSYALTAMKWAVAEGYINGTSAATLSPQTSATRAQVAKFLVNFIESY